MGQIHEIALTIKPTLSCNMKCRHCFNGDKINTHERIDKNEVIKFMELACRDYKDVKVTFHGGEPTLAGNEFYKQMFQVQHELSNQYGASFSNNFTTNGLLLDEELADLLIENDTLINVSFDGPYNHLLRGNSEKVYENILMLKEKKARFRIFCTLSKGSCGHLQEIYNWFCERGLNFKTLPIEPRGYAAEESSLLMDIDEFITDLLSVYRYWITDKACCVRYYTFEEFAAFRRGVQFKPFWFRREIALNPDGKLYPFGRPNDVNFCLGRPSEIKKIEDCFSSPEYTRMLNIINNYRRETCSMCDSCGTCNGVCYCISLMYVDNDDFLRYSCEKANKIFTNVLKINDEIRSDFQSGNYDKYNDTIKKTFLQIGQNDC